jgi:hypothetical protein
MTCVLGAEARPIYLGHQLWYGDINFETRHRLSRPNVRVQRGYAPSLGFKKPKNKANCSPVHCGAHGSSRRMRELDSNIGSLRELDMNFGIAGQELWIDSKLVNSKPCVGGYRAP